MTSEAQTVPVVRRLLPSFFGGIAAVFILVIVFQVDRHEAQDFRRTVVSARMEVIHAKLEQALQDRLQLARGLAAFAKSHATFTNVEFLNFARALEGEHKGVRSLQLAPGAVVKYMTKPELNEAARGHDLLSDPKRRSLVQQAIDERRFVIAGPLELIQGGVAIIGRTPVFIRDHNGVERFWGFATVLLELDALLAEAGIGTEDDGLTYALRGKDGLGAAGDLFMGEQRVFDEATAVRNVTIPGGSWQLAAMATANWPGVWPGQSWLWVIGSALAVLGGVMTDVLIRRPMMLQSMVDQATQALRKSEERYKTLATIAPVGIYQLAGVDELIFVNEQWSRITGMTGPRYDSPSYREMIHPDDVGFAGKAWDDLLEKRQPFSLEYRFIQPDGNEIWVLETAMVQEADDPENPVFVASVIDITDRRVAEIEVARSNTELEQFALIASHDLKAPLRAVSGYCAALQETCVGKLDDEANGYVCSALDGTQRMRQLIDDLLEFSRAGLRERTIELVDCQDVLQTVLADLCFEIEKLGAEIETRDLPTLRADRSDLVQLFQNLVGNGLKYRGGDVPKIVIFGEDDGTHWRIAVSDNGIGVPDEHAGIIFDVFKRLHARDEYSGTGMGLAICKKIVERNGGRIWLDTGYEGGTRVCFTWPR